MDKNLKLYDLGSSQTCSVMTYTKTTDSLNVKLGNQSNTRTLNLGTGKAKPISLATYATFTLRNTLKNGNKDGNK